MKIIPKHLLIHTSLVTCCLFANIARADVSLNPLFADDMVIQRDAKASVWGTADPGEKVSVDFNGQSVSTTTPANGEWKLAFSPMPMNATAQSMIVQGNNRLELSNILIGDLWVCSGQSNMQFQLRRDSQAATEIPKSANPNIRFLLTKSQASDTPLKSVKVAGNKTSSGWRAVSPETVGDLTAVGYWFAKELQKSTGVPIGLLSAYQGGTPVEFWLPKEALLASDGGSDRWAEHLAALKAFPEKDKIYQTEMLVWKEKTQGLSAAERKKIKQPKPPYGPNNGRQPCGLYYGTVAPYTPAAIKGVIWYQGESNGLSPMRKAVNYQSTFMNLIRSWRAAWGQDDLPFLFVQLPGFSKVSAEPQDSAWLRVRDAQMQALALPNTGMAVALDVGNEKDVHPKNKQPVGERLAQWAKGTIYGMDVVPSGPLYQSMEVQGNKIVITFKHEGKGLETRDVTLVGGHQVSKETLQAFTLCGADKKFVWAEAKITGSNQVTVSAPEVSSPVAVRYAWTKFPLCNLYNKEGLPAAAFRTDNYLPEVRKKGR